MEDICKGFWSSSHCLQMICRFSWLHILIEKTALCLPFQGNHLCNDMRIDQRNACPRNQSQTDVISCSFNTTILILFHYAWQEDPLSNLCLHQTTQSKHFSTFFVKNIKSIPKRNMIDYNQIMIIKNVHYSPKY